MGSDGTRHAWQRGARRPALGCPRRKGQPRECLSRGTKTKMNVYIRLSPFFSPLDEELFFVGLSRIAAIAAKGEGRGLCLCINLSKLKKADVVALMGLLTRYRIAVSPLRELAAHPRFRWMTLEGWYWERALARGGR
jgi:hypothetical protein